MVNFWNGICSVRILAPDLRHMLEKTQEQKQICQGLSKRSFASFNSWSKSAVNNILNIDFKTTSFKRNEFLRGNIKMHYSARSIDKLYFYYRDIKLHKTFQNHEQKARKCE